MEIKQSRWVWVFVIILISSVLIFMLNDREKKPEWVKLDNQTGNQTNVTAPKCPDDYQYVAAKNVCYKENPLGHTMVTFPQMLATIFTIALVTVYEFRDWRWHLSSKILPFQNKYAEELNPIPKSPDIHEKKGIVWVRGGYDALISGTTNELFVGKRDLTARIGNNVMLKGKLQKISPQYIYEFTGYDLQLTREILNNPLLQPNKLHQIERTDSPLVIYVVMPLGNNDKKAYVSLKGAFGFNADRFSLVIETLFKMRKGSKGIGYKLKEATKVMLGGAKDMSQDTAVIADAVGKTQKAEIDMNIRQPQSEPQQEGRQQL